MQSKGIIKWLALLLGVACIWQLSFTFVTRSVEADAEAAAAKVAAQYEDADEARVKYNEAYNKYLDEKWDDVVYNLGVVKYTYEDCKNRELVLGLDLRGGMNVMLEVKASDVIRTAVEANEKYAEDLDFRNRMEEALFASAAETETVAAIEAFLDKCDEQNPADFAVVFGGASRESVISDVESKVDNAAGALKTSLEKRIDGLGVTQPTIQRVAGTNRVNVELPGIKEPERVSKLLASTALLEFWAVAYDDTYYDAFTFIWDGFDEAVRTHLIRKGISDADIEKLLPVVSQLIKHKSSDDENKLQAPYVCYASRENMAVISEYLALPEVKASLPEDVYLCWENKSVKGSSRSGDFRLMALKGANGAATPLMDGKGITARVDNDPMTNEPIVSMTMDSDAADLWSDITRDHVGRQVAIVMDDIVYSAPVVHERITGGSSRISGNFSIQEATDLVNILEAGSTDVRATIVYSEVVGPSLGEKAVHDGMISFIVAFILVLLYMAFFYKTAGWMANIALMFNVLLLIGVLCSFGAVLTLPGIAGIVLTMGMAVDANVIIFERVKEELRAGKGLSAAIKDGFKNAYSAIIDGNLTTIITGVVLFVLGTGPVRGFATTLVLGIITSLFSSIFVTRLLLDSWATRRGTLSFSRKLTENFLQGIKFNFIANRKYSYIISGVLIIASIISLSTLGLNKGIEFTGGRAYVVKFDNSVNIEDVRENIELAFASTGDAANSSVEVKQFGDDNQVRITTQFEPTVTMVKEAQMFALEGVEDPAVAAEIRATITADRLVEELIYEATVGFNENDLTFEEFANPDNGKGITQSNKVDESFSGEMTKKSIWAVIISLAAIGLYIAIRFRRWQWALGATAALAHNAILVIGLYSMLYAVMPFNLEVNQAFIAAILTIIGYSINDTVVIFDRIREYIGLYPKRDLKTNINNAICATLSRTINTSGTTLVTLLSIFILGGESIRGFVFALIVGVIIGTYSSVFIATPIAYDCQRKKAKKAAKELEAKEAAKREADAE